jgi:hypothetical protein
MARIQVRRCRICIAISLEAGRWAGRRAEKPNGVLERWSNGVILNGTPRPFHHAITSLFQHSRIPAFHYSNSPLLQHSNSASLHYSIILSFQYFSFLMRFRQPQELLQTFQESRPVGQRLTVFTAQLP